LDYQAKSSNGTLEAASADAMGWWMVAAYFSFSAWLFHSFAVRFFVTIRRLLVKFLVKA
jgi:hypothetical protein